MSDLTTELQRMADDAARQARPPAAAEVIRQGDRRRRRSLTRQSLGGLLVAGAAGAGIALGLGLTGSTSAHGLGTTRIASVHSPGTTKIASAHGPGTIRTAAFTLVRNANGTATLTINSEAVFEPGTLQRDLAQDGIPALVTSGSFCSSDPAPAGIDQVVSVPKLPPGESPTPQHGPGPAMTINPRAMPAGTELSFGSFQLANGEKTLFALIDKGSYTCTSTAPLAPPPGSAQIGRVALSGAPS